MYILTYTLLLTKSDNNKLILELHVFIERVKNKFLFYASYTLHIRVTHHDYSLLTLPYPNYRNVSRSRPFKWVSTCSWSSWKRPPQNSHLFLPVTRFLCLSVITPPRSAVTNSFVLGAYTSCILILSCGSYFLVSINFFFLLFF